MMCAKDAKYCTGLGILTYSYIQYITVVIISDRSIVTSICG